MLTLFSHPNFRALDIITSWMSIQTTIFNRNREALLSLMKKYSLDTGISDRFPCGMVRIVLPPAFSSLTNLRFLPGLSLSRNPNLTQPWYEH